MLAIRVNEFGGPDVLRVVEVEPSRISEQVVVSPWPTDDSVERRGPGPSIRVRAAVVAGASRSG